jgi:hypothetical protein
MEKDVIEKYSTNTAVWGSGETSKNSNLKLSN